MEHILASCPLHVGRQSGISDIEITRQQHFYLRYDTSIYAPHLGVIDSHDMQHYRIVGLVAVVPMGIPVGGLDMNLHVADPFPASYHNPGIAEIRTGISVISSDRKHID